MAAIPYPDSDSTPGLTQVYQRVAGLGRPVINLYRVMGHSPEGLDAYLGLSHFVRDNSSLPPQLRELAILATGATIGCDYETGQHVAVARQAGLPEAKIQALLAGDDNAAFDETERAVLAYARQVAQSRSASEATLAALRQHLSLRQISDLAITVGMYHMCAAVLMPLQVELEG